MATNYSWKIGDIFTKSVEAVDNVVYKVNWEYIGVDEDTECTFNIVSSTDISTDDLSSFVSYDSVSPEIIIEWIESALGKELIDSHKLIIESRIVKMIEDKEALSTPAPWQPIGI